MKIGKPLTNSGRGKTDALLMKVTKRRVGISCCFLCGKRLTKKTRSDEHVFPAWIQNRFNLWNQELILLNGTTIPYRLLKIPYCKVCNNEHLGKIEQTMEAATRKGAASVRKLNPLIVLVWLSKILYGLLYREHLLSFDRKIPFKGRLVRRTFLKRLKTFYLFLQAARVTVQFAGSFPASIFVFSLQLPLNAKAHFDFQDSPLFLTVACRIGKVGIIAALQDGGSQHQLFQRYMARFQKVRLHPIQFNELVSKVFYKASLMKQNAQILNCWAG